MCHRKAKILRWLLIFLLLFSCGLDIYATVSDANFLVLEGNFAANLIGSVWPIIIFKIIFCIGLCIAISVPKYLAKSNFTKYFYIHIIILLTFLQFVAGINNMIAKEDVKDFVNEHLNTSYETPAEIPAETVKEIAALPKKQASAVYIGMIARVFYLPFALGLLSFWLWENIFYKPEEDDDI
jgi:hypothetical protein